MKDFKRTDRIEELMQRNLARLIQNEIKDPRLPGLITVSAVKVSRDLSYAKVYFTVFNGDPDEACAVLNNAASYLRTALAKIIVLRTIPQLKFVHDKSLEYASRLNRLINDVTDADETNSSEDES